MPKAKLAEGRLRLPDGLRVPKTPGVRRTRTMGAMALDGTAWFDEVDLDPDSPWLRMGTRQLGDRPWLVIDERRAGELVLKEELLTTRPADVFAGPPGSEPAGMEVLDLVRAELRAKGIEATADPALHPLDAAGRLVQEDLCLLRRRPDGEGGGWLLAAASLCFPSRWGLADKLGHPLIEVHAPVPGYDVELSPRVDRLLDRLGEQIVWRRNWFVHPDGSLFQPQKPAVDPVISPPRCATGLFCRSERQTLRRLPTSGWVLFTIRIQQADLATFLAEPARRDRMARYLSEADPAHAAHRGLSPPQVESLQRALALWPAGNPGPERRR